MGDLMMETFAGEEIILQQDKFGITLTNKRIRQQHIDFFGDTSLTSILLQHITSCTFKRVSNKKFLILGLVLLFSGFVIDSELHLRGYADTLSKLFYYVSVILIIYYALTIKRVVCISSPSENIVIHVRAQNRKELIALINKIEETILKANL